MRTTTVSRRVAMVVAVVLSGCGDDDGGEDETMGDGGAGDAGGMDSGTPPDRITPLGDNVAGRSCMNAGDCVGAMCATQIAGTGLVPEPTPGGYCTGPCESDLHCGEGGVCIGALQGILDGQCFAACSETSDCREGYLCAGGLMIGGLVVPDSCRPAPATDQLEDGVAGTPCEEDGDCGGGRCATMRGGFMGQGGTVLPEGYCTGACLEDAHCGDGGVCAPALLPGSAGSCYQSCGADDDCTRDGYRCREVASEVRGCDTAPDPLPDNSAGNACTDDADCGGGPGTCAATLPGSSAFGQRVDAPGGYCSQDCAEQSDCGEGGVCVGGFLGGTCYKPCTDSGECRDGYLCQMRGGMSGATVCAPEPPPSDADAG